MYLGKAITKTTILTSALLLIAATACGPTKDEPPSAAPSSATSAAVPGPASAAPASKASAASASKGAPVREGSTVARSPESDALYVADEDHGMVHAIAEARRAAGGAAAFARGDKAACVARLLRGHEPEGRSRVFPPAWRSARSARATGSARARSTFSRRTTTSRARPRARRGLPRISRSSSPKRWAGRTGAGSTARTRRCPGARPGPRRARPCIAASRTRCSSPTRAATTSSRSTRSRWLRCWSPHARTLSRRKTTLEARVLAGFGLHG